MNFTHYCEKPRVSIAQFIKTGANFAFQAVNSFSAIVNNLFKTFGTILLLCFSTLIYGAGGGPKLSRQEYIDLWKVEAMRQMQLHRIPASITLAQAILESGNGNSYLAQKANNHFGIKCHDWNGKKVYRDDDARNECFRSYRTANESFEDHSLFLKRSRYAFLYDYKITDYKAWAKGLKKAGYATNPKYPELLIRIIEENNLHEYDRIALKNQDLDAYKSRDSRSSRDGDAIVVTIGNAGNEVFVSDNRIKYIIATDNITAVDLAEKLNMGRWQIAKYNDLQKNSLIEKGERVYLQPKRNKNREVTSHTVAEGETLRDISQRYGVKIKKILKHSDLPKNYKAKPGDVLYLKRR